jgi:1-acyl-sn-glycerol-3-phosphate acyltransferase
VPPFHWWRTVFVLIPVIGLYTIVLGIVSLVSGLADRRGRIPHACARLWGRLILATSGVRFDLGGASLPADGRSCLFVANHASFYDIPILFTAVPRQLRIIAKESLGRFPFIGWHLRRSGHLLVDRQRGGPALFAKMRRLAGQGASLIVFPEGSRTPDGHVQRFKRGSFLLAIENQWPIVPVSVDGSRTVMPKGRLMVCPARVRVTVHAPISTEGLTREHARELAATAEAIVASAIGVERP